MSGPLLQVNNLAVRLVLAVVLAVAPVVVGARSADIAQASEFPADGAPLLGLDDARVPPEAKTTYGPQSAMSWLRSAAPGPTS